MKKTNARAGFWRRLLSKLIDFTLVAAIAIPSVFFMLEKTTEWHFKEPWLFYIWAVELMLLIAIVFLIIPMRFNGKTIGNYLMRIRIVSLDNSLKVGILKREAFFSLTWIFLTFLVTTIINHTLIIKYASTKQDNLDFSTIENLRIGIVSSLGSISVFIQMFISISTIVRKDKTGLHDKWAKTIIIRDNVFVDVKEGKQPSRKIKPKLVSNEPVEWI